MKTKKKKEMLLSISLELFNERKKEKRKWDRKRRMLPWKERMGASEKSLREWRIERSRQIDPVIEKELCIEVYPSNEDQEESKKKSSR